MKIYRTLIPQVNIEYIPTDTYKFNASKRLHWLQRICLWMLDKLGCEQHDTQSTFSTIEVNFDDIADLIMEQAHGIEQIHYRRCKYVLVGHRQFSELAKQDGNMLFRFSFLEGRRYAQFRGIQVVVVPWFDGVLCLHDLEQP